MDFEEIEIDGQLITVSLPVGDIHREENCVRYQDATGGSEASFSSPTLAKQFADFLVQLSSS